MFQHPLAGPQLVKGGLQPGETVFQATSRELYEESGLRAGVMRHLTSAEIDGERWIFTSCFVLPPPDTWDWQTLDDQGHTFRFFWHDAFDPAPPDCHASFVTALALIVAANHDVDPQ